MTAEEWAQIKDLFEAALNVPAESRAEYLQSACGDRPHIYKTVEELIQNHQTVLEASSRIRFQSAPALLDGELIAGRFRVLRFIAAGGMGEVYEAYDERLKLRLALKTLRPAILAEAGGLERFQREIVLARGVSHDNLCRVFDFVEHEVAGSSGRKPPGILPCITMELLEGETLAQFVQRARPLPVSEALPLIRQIAEGLQVLHEHGVVHRDLKPSNVMLTRRRNGSLRAVVMDFGLAKRDDPDADFYDTQSNVAQAGAPYFMAPELLRNSKPTIASDIYSFGLLIDELVTRTRAFPASSLQALYFAKLWERPVSPSDRSDELPPHWEHAIVRCLDPSPGARFEAAADVVSALATPDAAAAVTPTAAIAPSPGRPPLRLSRRTLLTGAAAIPVLTGAAAVAAIAIQRVETTVDVFNIDNLTKNQEYDYLCNGITNELMRGLLHLNGVRVVPLYSTRTQAPGEPKHAANFSLDGLLQAASGRIRLSMKLTDNRNGALVWSENYDRQAIENPIELESEIAHGAVMALEQRITAGADGHSAGWLAGAATPIRRWFGLHAGAALPAPPTYSNAAFDLYMRGHNLLEELTPESAAGAVGYFKRAIEADQNFALAYAAVSDALISGMNYDIAPRAETVQSARQYAEDAVRRDPRLAEAHMVLGAVQQIEWDWSAAERSFREALRLKPNLARARRWHAGMILQFRRFDEAIAETRRALEQDPYDRSGAPAFGLVLTIARHYQEAESVLRQSLESKDTALARLNLAQLYACLGSTSTGAQSAGYFRAAIAQVDAAIALNGNGMNPSSALTDSMYALYHTMRGSPQSAAPYLERSEAAVEAGSLSPVMVAKVYAARGDQDRAVKLLFRAAAWHDRRLLYVNVTPFFDSLQRHPGFQALLQKMQLS